MDGVNAPTPAAVALKACPFCGASPWPDLQNGNEIPGDYGPNGGRSFKLVWCNTCGASGAEKETEAEAIAAWNTRAALSATPLAQMREANERLRECKVIPEGSRLDHITSALLNIIAGIEDEGDRVYFGSTNDADALRKIAHELDRARFAALTGEAP